MTPRTITASTTVLVTDEYIICNSATTISVNLNKSVGNNRELVIKNIGAGLVTICAVNGDYIDSSSTKDLGQWEGVKLQDDIAGTWLVTPYQVTSEGGAASGSRLYNVDGSRTDSYTADGSEQKPYKTIKAAQDAINTLSATLLGSEANFDTSKFILNIAPGVYSDNITISTAKYIRYNMAGVTISGNVSITQEQVGVTNYYGKVEFVGAASAYAEKGRNARITGTVTFLKTAYDSLAYDAFIGIELTGAIKYGATAGTGYGTWVLLLDNTYLASTATITTNFAAGSHCVLLITKGFTEVRSILTGAIDLYDCDNTYFYGGLNITPVNGGTITRTIFGGSVSVIASKTWSVDAISWKSLIARTPTTTGMIFTFLDKTGPALTPVVRTNNPVIGSNDINQNIAALDACIGTDGDITPTTRTVGQIVVNSTVNAKFEVVDQVIGFDAQVSGTPKNISTTQTIYQNLDALDTYKSVQTVKKTIGGIGVTADFNFVTAADTNEQVIDLGAIVPAKARIIDVFTYTDEVFTGATTLVADTGTSSGGGELITSATIYAANAITASPNAGAFIATPSASATHIYLNATPGANWSNVTAGKVSVYVTFINVANI